MYRSASWNRSSHRVVPAKVIAVAAATPARVLILQKANHRLLLYHHGQSWLQVPTHFRY